MSMNRRQFLGGTAAGVAGAPFLSVEGFAQGKQTINLQLGWLLSGNQIGEVCAKAMGFYDAEGLDLKFQPGGPSIDGVAVVASGPAGRSAPGHSRAKNAGQPASAARQDQPQKTRMTLDFGLVTASTAVPLWTKLRRVGVSVATGSSLP